MDDAADDIETIRYRIKEIAQDEATARIAAAAAEESDARLLMW